MKKHTAPQFDFAFPAEPFHLAAQTALDGDKLAHARDIARRDNEAAARAQAGLTFDGEASYEEPEENC